MTERHFAEQLKAQAEKLLTSIHPNKRAAAIRAAAELLLKLVERADVPDDDTRVSL